MVTPAAEREAVALLKDDHEMSERRACQLLQCCRMTMRYGSVKPDDTVLRDRMKAIAIERQRFGYRRIHVLLRREGVMVNHKRLFRLYREEKLSVRKRGGRKRALGTRAPMLVPLLPNQRWSLDFVSDQFTDCRRFRVLTVIDDCTRECIALVADTSLSGRRVARELHQIIAQRGSSFKRDGFYALSHDCVIGPDRCISHRHSTALQKLARPPLAHLMVVSEKCDSFPLRGGRHHFFPSKSFSATLSNMASASNRFSLAFSSSRPLNFLASDTSMPPNLAFHL